MWCVKSVGYKRLNFINFKGSAKLLKELEPSCLPKFMPMHIYRDVVLRSWSQSTSRKILTGLGLAKMVLLTSLSTKLAN